eukprot:TRINITY_DN239_c0_g1_i1.p1 TRINITY_DN239_c0_g1~~TRINITY_DN239_c0_g1_i1.p1  ORF type:complete len:510 (+),score=117.81 TRINITY_DN239_c0_g1_i1:199-1728(+)
MSLPQLDIVFCCDCTGSMGSYIRSAQENIIKISEEILATEQRDLRFGLVCYRDHPPQDSTYITRVFDFTNDIAEMKRNVDTMAAGGGGDGPEAVTAGLHAALGFRYREEAVKICVIIADAPPHGIGCPGDGFADGSPDGHDPLVIAREMRDRNIIIYSVACGHSLQNYPHALDFFKAISDITTGKLISIGDAALLPPAIIGGASVEICMEKLSLEVEMKRRQMKMADPSISDDEIIRRVTQEMMNANRSVSAIPADREIVAPNAEHFISSANLAEARGKLKDRASESRIPTSSVARKLPFTTGFRKAPRASKPIKAPRAPVTASERKAKRDTRKSASATSRHGDAMEFKPATMSPIMRNRFIGITQSPYVPKDLSYYSAKDSFGHPLRRSERIRTAASELLSPSLTLEISPCATPTLSSTPEVSAASFVLRPTTRRATASAPRTKTTRRVPPRTDSASASASTSTSTAGVVTRSSHGLLETRLVTHEEVSRAYERNLRRYGDAPMSDDV